MSVSILVPWRTDNDRRELIWSWVASRWRRLYPHYELIAEDSGHEPFSRGASINRGFRKANGDILVLADADTIVSNPRSAIKAAGEYPWVIAYGNEDYYTLPELATDELLLRDPACALATPTSWILKVASYSGTLVMHRDAFEAVGGYDERFTGWGYEDDALKMALDTLVGPHVRVDGWAAHLWHEEGPRFNQPYIATNRALCDEYLNAAGNDELMRKVVRCELL